MRLRRHPADVRGRTHAHSTHYDATPVDGFPEKDALTFRTRCSIDAPTFQIMLTGKNTYKIKNSDHESDRNY